MWWPSIDSDIEKRIQSCRPCQLVGKDGKPETLIIGDLPDSPWQPVYMDICGPFPSGDSLFTMMDGYSCENIVKRDFIIFHRKYV